TFVLDAFAVSHVTSGRHLLEITGDRPPAAAGLLAVGGLDYGSAAGQDKGARTSWPPLPGTRLEVEAVAALVRAAFPRERPPPLLVGPKTDAAVFTSQLPPATGAPRWRFLHVATHAFYDASAASSGGRISNPSGQTGRFAKPSYETKSPGPT